MHYNISFPNLGIYLDHVGKSISIFGFSIAYYGMIIGAAILIGFLIATVEAKRTGQNPEDYLDMGIVGVIAGIAGARIYYVIFSWDLYKDNLLSIFNLREGGLAIYGGVIGAVIAVFVMAAVKKKSPFQILDTIALALLNGQMLGYLCARGINLSRKRNIIFTAMTRSKAWVRVSGIGDDMDLLIQEFNSVKERNFQLEFTYPDKSQRKNMRIIHRDMTQNELRDIRKSNSNLADITSKLANGEIRKEDLDEDTVNRLKDVLYN